MVGGKRREIEWERAEQGLLRVSIEGGGVLCGRGGVTHAIPRHVRRVCIEIPVEREMSSIDFLRNRELVARELLSLWMLLAFVVLGS